MAHPRVPDGDGLQIWTAAVNTSNRGQTTRGGPPASGLDVGPTTHFNK
jgi:hypothetical protein